jgi:hypothetical protein
MSRLLHVARISSTCRTATANVGFLRVDRHRFVGIRRVKTMMDEIDSPLIRDVFSNRNEHVLMRCSTNGHGSSSINVDRSDSNEHRRRATSTFASLVQLFVRDYVETTLNQGHCRHLSNLCTIVDILTR